MTAYTVRNTLSRDYGTAGPLVYRVLARTDQGHIGEQSSKPPKGPSHETIYTRNDLGGT